VFLLKTANSLSVHIDISGMEGSLEEVNKNLKDVQDRREKLIKGTRDVVMLCSKSIVAMHHGQLEDANNKMDQAKTMLEEFRKYARQDLYRYIAVAEQELVEAYALRAVIDYKPMPSMKELDVTGESYLTGLLDCVGEIKRLVYDRMRSGNEEDAEKLFEKMEEIYNAIYPFAVYDNIVSGLRRKLDVARMLIEDIRATVTEESRRKALIEAVDSFEKRISKEEKGK
jgi:translin